jgi:hypothetical protein
VDSGRLIIQSMHMQRPKHLPKYAKICLERLAEAGLGDKISLGGAFGLIPDDEQAFSFQIAKRSGQLKSPAPSPWKGVLIDSFDDLVAAKMVALVERGAPRDFVDIFTLCQDGLVTTGRCWELWGRRQELANDDADSLRARLAVHTHLARIEQHRPLESISDSADRANAQRLRQWFKEEFFSDLG